jgi:hypothetical protein
MARPIPRRLTLADLAILIAGMALSMGFQNRSWATAPMTLVEVVIGIFSMGLAFALIVVRAIRPRPRWRAVFRQPGTSACLAILAHMLMIFLFSLRYNMSRHGIGSWPPRLEFSMSDNRFGGAWVVVAWTTLALARAWRPEPSWIDRSGRVLGVVAILHWLRWALIW